MDEEKKRAKSKKSVSYSKSPVTSSPKFEDTSKGKKGYIGRNSSPSEDKENGALSLVAQRIKQLYQSSAYSAPRTDEEKSTSDVKKKIKKFVRMSAGSSPPGGKENGGAKRKKYPTTPMAKRNLFQEDKEWKKQSTERERAELSPPKALFFENGTDEDDDDNTDPLAMKPLYFDERRTSFETTSPTPFGMKYTYFYSVFYA
ncbi:uncharacterized protein LOC106642323 [Copidosoma floridanum]|uniref:uncharacterized protein LOC106642323 n=1 Tax=Copidosoma floridanum TaxID=29053 RepID=UPI0006C979E0|nr:uncharacterized protein LOC106642323 [Copidosoma floridanum]